MKENRSSMRRRVLKGGTIALGGGVVQCRVRNMSDAGAALEFDTLATIPHRFRLAITSDLASYACEVVWRKDNRIGVKFLAT